MSSPKMDAWTFNAANGALHKNLKFTRGLARPPTNLSPEQVSVQVTTASINAIDYKVPELGMISRLMISRPASPGLDFSGKVVSLGSAVDKLKEGQLVFGRLDGPTQFGTLGPYVNVPKAGVIPLPSGVDPDHAAAMATTGLTAYQCIVPYVKKGDKIFINGGSGGTGTFGIQIAKVLGCEVTTSCSTANVALCKELGADEVLDYRSTNVAQALQKKGQVFNLVVDNVGAPAELYIAADSSLVTGGKYVQIGAEMSIGGMAGLLSRMLWPSFLGGGKHAFEFVNTTTKNEDMSQLGKWLGEGKIRAVIDSTFEYEDAPKAYEKLKTGRAVGKIVVHVGSKP